MKISKHLAALSLTLAAALPLTAVAPAQAQTAAYPHASHAVATVDSFGVKQLSALTPGSELAFSLSGTPGASVVLRIAGATDEVPMTEVRAGVYQGAYTVRSRDRLSAASLVTAQITKDGQASTVSMDQSLVLGARSPAPSAATGIAAFTVTAPERARPGDELVFALSGQPAGKARVQVEGVVKSIALTEVRRGVYEGSYTLRRGERINRNLVATGYLTVNRQESSQRFERRLAELSPAKHDDDRAADRDPARAPCAECGVIESVSLVEVRGDKPNVLGTIAGGVIGGVIGNQVGGGTGKDLATIVGAVGGAYAGNRIENSQDKVQVHRVLVRLDSGGSRSVDYAADPGLKVGAAVRFDKGVIARL